MNTYPQEYIVHSVPVLAVYGLNDQPSSPSTPRQHRPSSRASLGTTLATIFSSKQQYNVYESARIQTHNSPGSPPFRVLFVDKDFTLPERTPAAPNLPPPHSDLSPLSRESPLYPDGFMTPLWVKRHMETPSAIVGFYDLWDWSMESGSPPRPKRETGPLASHVLIDPTEREKDTLLSQEINTHRKYYQEKGIKFAVTIILKRQHTDDSAVEERLAMLRKQSGLDSKGSMFTIAPGTQHDMQEFVNELYRSLYEPAIQFYNARIKKLRKKRSKLPSPASAARLSQPNDSNEPQPLSIQGWMMRYDYKIGFFLETRQDIEGAMKSYESAYTLLSDMLAPKSSITPGQTGFPLRGKRWEEARELLDCINIKICRFYLYMNDSSSALAQLNGHLQTIQTYSNVWGIGEQSLEYWAWLSKQYRIFADLIDTATQHGFKIPIPTSYMSGSGSSSHLPGSPLLGASSGAADAELGGCNPAAVLQHPGFYYHLAAMCSAERRRRFLEIDATKATGVMQILLANEKQVDHSNQTIELLTKSYEQFKKNRNGRMTLYLAAEIAGTYYETGKYEMALKFFERIGKTYRKEKWNMVLTSILRWSLRCAKELKSWDRAFEFLLELLSSELPMPDQKRQDIQKELMDLMQTKDDDVNATAAAAVPIAINMDEINPLLTCGVQFRTGDDYVDAPVHFQISLKTGKTSPPLPLPFASMRILFSDPQYNLVLYDDGSEEDLEPQLALINCHDGVEKVTEGEFEGWTTKSVDLRIAKNQTRVFEGSILPKECGELKIIGVCLDLKSSHRHISLNYDLDRPTEDFSDSRRKWLSFIQDSSKPAFTLLDGRGDLNKIKISQRPPRVHIKVDHQGQALLDELYKVNVTLENEEQLAIEGFLYAEMKDSDGQEQMATFSADRDDDHQVSLGRVEPGQSCTKSLYLRGNDIPGTRIVTLKVSYNAAGNGSQDNAVEKREVLRVPFRTAFESGFRLKPLADKLEKSDGDPELSRSETWLVASSIRNCADIDLEIEEIEFEQQPFEHPITTLSLISEPGPLKSSEWKSGYLHNANYLFRLRTEDVTELQPSVPVGSINIFWKRSGQHVEQPFKTNIALPSLEFRPPSLSIIAEAPSEIYVGEPFTLTYTINNPTVHLAEFNASIELSDAFVFSGLKMLRGRILPLGRATYYYTCYPLIAGKVRLPRLKVIAKQLGVEKEVPIEMLEHGNDGLKQGVLEQRPPLMVFANARRIF